MGRNFLRFRDPVVVLMCCLTVAVFVYQLLSVRTAPLRADAIRGCWNAAVQHNVWLGEAEMAVFKRGFEESSHPLRAGDTNEEWRQVNLAIKFLPDEPAAQTWAIPSKTGKKLRLITDLLEDGKYFVTVWNRVDAADRSTCVDRSK